MQSGTAGAGIPVLGIPVLGIPVLGRAAGRTLLVLLRLRLRGRLLGCSHRPRRRQQQDQQQQQQQQQRQQQQQKRWTLDGFRTLPGWTGCRRRRPWG